MCCIFWGCTKANVQATLNYGDDPIVITDTITRYLIPRITTSASNGVVCYTADYFDDQGNLVNSIALDCFVIPEVTIIQTDTIVTSDTIFVQVPVLNEVGECITLRLPVVKYIQNNDQYWVGFEVNNVCSQSYDIELVIRKGATTQRVFLTNDLGPITRTGLITSTQGTLLPETSKTVGADFLSARDAEISYELWVDGQRVCQGVFRAE